MTDIVERLRGPSPLAWVPEAIDEIEHLRAANERLRAALREIADAYGLTEDDENAGWMRDTARRAIGIK